VSETPKVVIERVFDAAIEDVFAAWTATGFMARWLSPTGYAEVQADVRVGGRLRVVMVGDGMRITHTGSYMVVEPPRRLSFTWESPYTGDVPSLVTVSLYPERDGTRLVLTHERLPREAAAAHEGGWTSILANLASALARVPSLGEQAKKEPS
jgi:uncharacterized protein YndB with AHSA1/START domain